MIITSLIVIVLIHIGILHKKQKDWVIDEDKGKFKPMFWVTVVSLFLFSSVLGGFTSHGVLSAIYR